MAEEGGKLPNNTPRRGGNIPIGAGDSQKFSLFEKLIVGLSWFIAIITFPISIFLMLRVLASYERAIIFRLGRILGGVPHGPGVVFVLPCTDTMERVDLRTGSFEVPPQEILTKDSVTVKVDAVVYYRLSDPLLAIVRVDRVRESTELLAQTTLRNVAGTRMLTELLSDKETLSHAMSEILDVATDPWGVKVERVEIKAIQLPKALQRSLATEAETLCEARAKVISAQGEMDASEALKEASDIMGQNKMALQLRYLQTLTHVCAEHNSTIIFPFPIDILETPQGLEDKPTPPSANE